MIQPSAFENNTVSVDTLSAENRHKGDRIAVYGRLSADEAVNLAHRLLESARFGDDSHISIENFWVNDGHTVGQVLPVVIVRVHDKEYPVCVYDEFARV